jgi:hypothetical protein
MWLKVALDETRESVGGSLGEVRIFSEVSLDNNAFKQKFQNLC